MQKEKYHILIPNQDITHIKDKINFTINARSKEIVAAAVVSTFSFDNVECMYSAKYKTPVGSLQVLQAGKMKIPYVNPKITIFENDFFSFRAGSNFEFRLHGSKDVPVKDSQLSLTTDTKFTLIYVDNKLNYSLKSINKFKYGIFRINSSLYIHELSQIRIAKIMPHLTIGNFTPSLYIAPFEHKYGVCGSAEYKNFPFFFSLLHVPDGIETKVGTKIAGKQNSLNVFLTNVTNLTMQATINFAKPMKVTAWMTTPIFDTQKAVYGCAIDLNYMF